MGWAVLAFGVVSLAFNATLCVITHHRRAGIANTIAWCGILYSAVPVIVGTMIIRTPEA